MEATRANEVSVGRYRRREQRLSQPTKCIFTSSLVLIIVSSRFLLILVRHLLLLAWHLLLLASLFISEFRSENEAAV